MAHLRMMSKRVRSAASASHALCETVSALSSEMQHASTSRTLFSNVLPELGGTWRCARVLRRPLA